MVAGAGWFTDAAVRIAGLLRVPRAVMGATLVSLATCLPELAVSVYAAGSGHVDTAVGNAVGSVLVNTCLILSLAVLVRPIPVAATVFLPKACFMVSGAIMAYAMVLDGGLSRAEGALLLALATGYAILLVGRNRHEREATMLIPRPEILRAGLRFAAGAALVVLGSRLLVNSAVEIARAIGVPEAVVALTLVALGTSLPELTTAVASLLKGYRDLSIGNIVGANFLNVTLVLGTAAAVRPLTVAGPILNISMPLMILAVTCAALSGVARQVFGRREGLALLLLFSVYLGLTLSRGG